MNGNLGPSMTNGVRPPLGYPGLNYSTPVPNLGYSLPGAPPQHTPQNSMQPHILGGSVPPVSGLPLSQQQYNPGYLDYSSSHSSLPPSVSGMHQPQQVMRFYRDFSHFCSI